VEGVGGFVCMRVCVRVCVERGFIRLLTRLNFHNSNFSFGSDTRHFRLTSTPILHKTVL